MAAMRLVDMEEYCQNAALLDKEKLLPELEKGRRSGEAADWLDADAVFLELANLSTNRLRLGQKIHRLVADDLFRVSLAQNRKK